ncbi:MAG: hypothetical protein ACE5FP_06725 [Gemmatimonadota bacterium]
MAVGAPVAAQDPAAEAEATEPVRVFIDCQTRCDLDHFRREIEFVDHVRDRQDADVHVLITRQRTGAGGNRYDLEFIGRRRFDGTADTLQFVSGERDTEQEVREGLTQTLTLGLVRFVAGSPVGRRLRIAFDAPDEEAAQTESVDDKWNFWVFRVGANAFLNGETSSRFLNLFGSTSASRITDASKLRLGVDASYAESRFDIDETSTVLSIRRSYGGRGLFVLSLNPHWSAGIQSRVSSSTFRNFDLSLRVTPAVEYNVFPYSESTRRQFRFLYSVGLAYFDYTEETIFNEVSETLPEHVLEIAYEVTQPWGSADLTLTASQFLSELSKNRVTLRGDIDLRVFRGLTLNVGGRVSHIADQLNLPKGDLTDEDILLRERERATSFSYFASIGLGFTFGSVFSNVVNPRFGR